MARKNMLEKTTPLDRPQPLPWCEYPMAKDLAQHGIQQLPKDLPLSDVANALSHRSIQYKVTRAEALESVHVLQMAQVIATSFALREPMSRHIKPPKYPPTNFETIRHTDPFGTDSFGAWTPENIIYWFVRLFVLTDPTSPKSAILVNDEALVQSLAIVDEEGQVIGGALNETMPPVDVEPPFRLDDPFMDAVLSFIEPILNLLRNQDVEAMNALCTQFPRFREAYENNQVGHHFMVARSDALATLDTFELVAATVELYQEFGYKFMVIEASNQWTGAACELLGGVRVHFAPFQAMRTIRESTEPLEGMVTSPNGFLSNKNSGCMFYVIRLD